MAAAAKPLKATKTTTDQKSNVLSKALSLTHSHTNNNFRLKLLRVNALQTRRLNGFSASDKDWSYQKELSKRKPENWLSTNSCVIVWILKNGLLDGWLDGWKVTMDSSSNWLWVFFAGSKSIHMAVRCTAYITIVHRPLSIVIWRSNYAGITICSSYFLWYEFMLSGTNRMRWKSVERLKPENG